jgi:hypothetical protein
MLFSFLTVSAAAACSVFSGWGDLQGGVLPHETADTGAMDAGNEAVAAIESGVTLMDAADTQADGCASCASDSSPTPGADASDAFDSGVLCTGPSDCPPTESCCIRPEYPPLNTVCKDTPCQYTACKSPADCNGGACTRIGGTGISACGVNDL